MSVSQVASRYAKSLLDLAIEQGKTEVVKGDMANFKEALREGIFTSCSKAQSYIQPKRYQPSKQYSKANSTP